MLAIKIHHSIHYLLRYPLPTYSATYIISAYCEVIPTCSTACSIEKSLVHAKSQLLVLPDLLGCYTPSIVGVIIDDVYIPSDIKPIVLNTQNHHQLVLHLVEIYHQGAFIMRKH